MEIGRLCAVSLIFAILFGICDAHRGNDNRFILGGNDLAPIESGLLKFTPAASGSFAAAPDSKPPLILAEKRTKRPDVLNKLRIYGGGWDISNKHYWASAGFTGATGFILAILWFTSFGIALGVHFCCKWKFGIKDEGSKRTQHICLTLLLLSTCAASTGCILLSVGQDNFHGEVIDTLSYVVNQSDFTVQILKNVTAFLSFAKTIDIEEVYLPSNVQNEIDKLSIDLNDAANTLSEKTDENSGKIRGVIDNVRCALIVVAIIMLVLAILGFLLSILGHKHAMYIFIMSGWLLVAVTFALCGCFVILNSVVGDTCTAMNEWVQYPHAETALSNILPCVDEKTTNQTLYQSKDVILQVVNVVNTVIWSIANINNPSQNSNSYYYNQSGPLMPPLCAPFDSQMDNKECSSYEVSFDNASLVWQNYTCEVSESGMCTSPGRITPDIYSQLVVAVNVSYALDRYAPLLLSLQDCNFVRDTFNSITRDYCPDLEHGLKLVNVGLALVSIGIMLCLILWIVYSNRPRREEVFATTLSQVKITK